LKKNQNLKLFQLGSEKMRNYGKCYVCNKLTLNENSKENKCLECYEKDDKCKNCNRKYHVETQIYMVQLWI